MSDEDNKGQQGTTEKKKMNPTSFRLSSEVLESFKSISQTLGSKNQDETMTALIQAYELQGNKANLPDNMQADIKKFEDCIGLIKSLYINSLEYANIIKQTESEKYKTELDLKDKTISDLEIKISSLQNDRESLDSQLKELSQTYNQAKQDIEQLQEELSNTTSDFRERLNDKEQVITSLNKTIKDLEADVISLKDKANSYDELQSENEILKQQLDDNKNEKERMIIESEKQLLEVQKEHNKKLEEMNNKYTKEIESYSSLLEQIERITASKGQE